MTRYRSKTVAAWLALVGGAFGAHRLYLNGWGDRWAWLHAPPSAAGLVGAHRAWTLGQDDRLAWLLLPLLGLMIAQGCLFALIHGLTPDDAWDARRNPGQPPRATAWGPILAAVAALMVGAVAATSAVAYGVQRFFEWQLEGRQNSSVPSP